MERYTFQDARFETGQAHGGARPIRYFRARQGTPQTPYNFVDLVEVPPGADIGMHTHARDNEETYIFISGRATMTVDGVTVDVGPGDVVVNDPGGTHGLHNDGTEPVCFVVVEVKSAAG